MSDTIRRGPRGAALCVIAMVCAAATAASATPAPPFAVLANQGSDSVPRMADAEASVREAEGFARQARVRPNPTVSLEIENFAGTGPYRGGDSSEVTASIETPLDLGRRQARIGAGLAGVSAANARMQQARSVYLSELAEAYINAEAAEFRVQLARDTLAIAREDERVAVALVEAGREAELRSLQARAATLSAQAGLDEAQAARDSAFARLTALSAAPEPYTTIDTSLLAHADRVERFTAPDSSDAPSVLAAQGEVAVAAQRVRVERTLGRPDITVSLGLRRFPEADASAVVAGVSVPLPVFDRNAGNIGAAQAALSGAQARLRQAQLDAQAEANAAIARADAAQSRLRAAREAERVAAEAARLADIGYRSGRLSLLELLTARRALADARTLTLDARLERLNAEIALARLSGVVPFGDQP